MYSSTRYHTILFLILIICISGLNVSAQQIRGVLAFDLIQAKCLFLKEVIGNETAIIDTCAIGGDGSFLFPSQKYPAGFYQLCMNDTNCVEIIVNPVEKEIDLYFEQPKLKDGISILKSIENQLLWSNKLFDKAGNEHRKALYISKSYVQATDTARIKYYKHEIRKLDSLQTRYTQSLISAYRGTYFAKTASLILLPGPREKGHYFDDIDFADISLIRSPVLPFRMIDYLHYYTKYDEEGFKSSVDTILKRAQINETAESFCLNFLLKLFDQTGPAVVFQYLIENYVLNNACGEQISGDALKHRAEAYRLLLPGNTAPDFLLPEWRGDSITLAEVLKLYDGVLLFFWSSECGFCKQEIPGLKRLYAGLKGLRYEIIGISLDTKEDDWRNALCSDSLPWINCTDLKGWESAVAKAYKIHKTPSFYLIDHQMKIVSRPKNVNELMAFFALQQFSNKKAHP